MYPLAFNAIASPSQLGISSNQKTVQDPTVWKTIKANGPGLNQNAAYYDISSNSIYVATEYNGVSISSDNGKTWRNVYPPQNDVSPYNNIHDVVANGSKIYAATNQGLAISQDSGASWKVYLGNAPYDGNKIQGLYISSDGKSIYAATPGGLYISHNAAQSWKAVTYYKNTRVYVDNGNIYLATAQGLMVSNNDGNNWTTYTTSNGLPSNTVLTVNAVGSTIYVGTDQGVAISNNGGKNWAVYTTANGLGSNIINKITISNGLIFAATTNGLSVSHDNGQSWTTSQIQQGLASNYITSVAVNGSNLYVTTKENEPSGHGGISISLDSGHSWQTSAFTPQSLGSNGINSIYIDKNTLYAATNAGLSVSVDTGKTWQTYSVINGLPSNDIFSVYGNGSNIILASNFQPIEANEHTNGGGVSISQDGGRSWTNAYPTDQPPNNNYLFTAFTAIGNTIYINDSTAGLYMSPDNGQSWKNIKHGGYPYTSQVDGISLSSNIDYFIDQIYGLSSQLPGADWKPVTPDPASEYNPSCLYYDGQTTIYIGTKYQNGPDYGGLFVSKDGGKSWTQYTVQNGLGSNYINAIYAVGQLIFAATENGLSISQDGGNTWRNYTMAQGIASNDALDVKFANGIVYVATQNGLSFTSLSQLQKEGS